MKRKPFPAVIIATLILVFCIFPAQGWLTRAFPAISGRATLDPTINIFDIPIRLAFPIDLILVPGLFIILYSTAILILSSSLAHRLTSVFFSVCTILLCLTAGSLISWLLKDRLPAEIRNSMQSLAINANLRAGSTTSTTTIPLSGDTLSLLGMIVGIALAIRIMSKSPKVPARTRARLTPEQRMTPYQRMLLERKFGTPHPPATSPALSRKPVSPPHEPSHGRCRNQPLLTLQPEAVNFRPLG